MIYYIGNNRVPLLEELRQKGFDVIIVNFPTYTTLNINNNQNVVIDGGAYYIESNALSIVKLIKGVNQKLVENGSTNQIALFGPSMGGQISRYALSYMEKKFQETNNNDWLHNVYLWVSIDSPHLGANIPLGDQALLNLVKGSSNAANEFYTNQLASPASQQQLIEFHKEKSEPNPFYPSLSSSPVNYNYHIADPAFLNAQTTSQGMNVNYGNNFFKKHYNEQNENGTTGSHGWPMNLRKIAVVNGSLTGSRKATRLDGSPLGYNFADAGEKVINLRGFQRVHIDLLFGSITWYVHIASLESQFMPKTESTERIARFKKLFDDKTTMVTNLNNRGVMDNVPGGYFNAQDQITGTTQQTNPVPGTNITSSFNTFSIENLFYEISQKFGGSRWFLHEYNPIHSFIPSFSSIAHLEPNQDWSNPLDGNLACPSNRKTPFDSYFGTENNTEHTSFTYECVQWLFKELDGHPQTPNFPIDSNDLVGPDVICLDTNVNYSFGEICRIPSEVVSWSISPNLEIVNQNGISLTIRGTSNGNAYIIATFENGTTVTKTFWLGTQEFKNIENINTLNYPQFSIEPDNTCETIGFKVNFSPENQTILEYQWEKVTQDVNWHRDYIVDNSNRVFIYPSCNKEFVFKVRVRNVCGWSEWFEVSYTINSCTLDCSAPFNGIIGSNFIMNPNPVNNGVLNISVKNNAPWFTTPIPIGNPSLDPILDFGTTNTVTNYSPFVAISIFNQLGVLVQSNPNVQLSTALNVSNLPQGTYLVIVEYLGQIEDYTIIKN